MFCTKCGKEISKEAMFCQNCGNPVQQVIEPTPSPVVKTDKTEFTVVTKEKSKKKIKPFVFIAIGVVVLLVIIAVIIFGGKDDTNNIEKPNESIIDTEESYIEAKKDSEENESENPILSDNPELLPTEISYNFIDYNDFSQYWFDGTFRCGTDFEEGDYYILPLFGAGAIYEVVDSPNDFSWTYNRIFRKVSVENGQYVRVSHGGIMVPADEVDTDNWSKYGVFLVGKDIPAGDYKMETISKEYDTALYAISGIDGAYQVCEGSVEKEPIVSDYLCESQEYITLENGQYIIITNIKLTNVSVEPSSAAESTVVSKELGSVETLFSLNYKEILSKYPNAEENSPDSNDRDKGLYIEGTFAEVQGEYYVYIYDGCVERVIFEPHDEDADGIKIVKALKASLGKCEEYDSERDSYMWKTENLEIKCYVEERTYFEWIGGELEVSDVADTDVGVVENIYTADDIPDELMNDKFKNAIALFSKGFSESGLNITNATTYDNGETYIFYLDNLEFLGDKCEEGSNFSPRIIYTKDAINNNGTPYLMFFAFANSSKSNGYEETVKIIEGIADALDISDTGLIDNDYSSISKLAIGDYATFIFPNLNLELTVSNTDGTVEIEIVPIE